jgi:hypothetical protein
MADNEDLHSWFQPRSGDLLYLDERLRQCPKCGEASLVRQEGCDVCVSCAYSKCG